MKLSHSASSCFQECPKKWEYRYKERLYSKCTTGALMLGTALDKSVEVLLKTRDYEKSLLEFNKQWFSQEINQKEEVLRTSTKIVYAANDLDIDLLSNDDLEDIHDTLNINSEYNRDNTIELITSIIKQRSVIGFNMLPKDRKMILNQACWACLLTKGELMIKAFNDKILPQIEEVLSIQEKVELVNEDGDEIVGYVDFVAKWRGIAEPVIFDLKTATREYDDDAVVKSPQLTLYTHCLSDKYKTRRAGFIVLSKVIRKNKKKVCSVCEFNGSGARHKTCPQEINTVNGAERCNGEWVETIDPSVYIQTLINEIPERMEELVMENLDNINKAIKNNIFTRNLSNCIKPYGLCEFYGVCHKKDYSDVIKVDKKEKV